MSSSIFSLIFFTVFPRREGVKEKEEVGIFDDIVRGTRCYASILRISYILEYIFMMCMHSIITYIQVSGVVALLLLLEEIICILVQCHQVADPGSSRGNTSWRETRREKLTRQFGVGKGDCAYDSDGEKKGEWVVTQIPTGLQKQQQQQQRDIRKEEDKN
ncbi:hypothetical protein BO79DRAFT_248623 [Aspergillus costaricaensis CBS 115574]|uniref:Uncharacterized protein n=1 Tax=Aspergillus costaricaensis CBS 115574 TaxID=1448317 RepID=A0ACD1I0H9_9EURO|nr:hypothetical protein BO79DRAFT_248623 [Aspergillus costaricaensis CBS 115574]RAK83762.1 hypothetical protein BO79DRAFT_248623 [Aspergillus costaricaensis CBS 115574]